MNKPDQAHPAFRHFLPASAWALFILFATVANVSTLESLRLHDLFAYDKPIHMVLFGGQAWLIISAFKQTGTHTKKQVLLACLISAAYGVFTECLQGLLTTSRFFDYFDMIANALGCLMVYFLFARKAV